MESTSEVVPNSVADKSVCVEDLPENTKTVEEAEVTITIKEHVVGENDKTKIVEETVTEKLKEEDDEEEIEEIVEEEVENNDEEVEEGVTQKITEKVIDNPDGGQTKTITVTTVKKVTPDGTKTVVTTTSSTKETPTIITTTPPTPTTEEVKTETTTEAPIEKTVKKQVSEEKKVEHNEHEEEEEEEIEEEEEEEDEEEEEEAEIVNEEESRKPVEETKKSDESSQQQEQHDQISSEAESQPSIATPLVKEQTVTDAPSAETKTNQQENVKQDNLNNTIKDIISSIDSNIQAEENFAHLKEMELELLKKQQELAKEIEQQKLLAQKLANENQIKQQLNKNLAQQETYQPTTNVSKYETFEEKQDENVYTRKSEKIETRESTNVTKKIDLHKIFTPATDAEEILPKNRKLYASSAFYSPTLHPTVEDQVELARRISHSLSDISNHQSRGQSMYVNRKKRSVKWVHEGCGQEDETENVIITNQEEKENNVSHHEKVPLKFLMNPYGQMRDINSLRESINTETGLLSPDVSAEVVTALQAQTGKGAKLFAKRRKVSEKWVVDESNVGAQSPSGLPDYHQYQQQPRPSTSPSILPAYTDAAKHRVQLNLHQEQLLEKYAKPGLKVVQTPWEAALNSGSASAAFVEEQKLSSYPNTTLTPSPTPQFYDANQGGAPLQSAPTVSDSYSKPYSNEDYQNYQTYAAPRQQGQNERQQYSGTNSQRELAYKPSIPQGWKAPSMSLPKDLYMPKEIPLQSYAPPPAASMPASVSPPFSTNMYESNQFNTYKPQNASPLSPYSVPEPAPAMNSSKPYGGTSSFPISKPYQQGFSSSYGGNNQPPKQQYLPPQSYQTIPQSTSQNAPQVSFNPSPLPYDKLAKFENPPADEGRYISSPPSRGSHLNVRGSKVRNVSPAPFAGSYNRPYTPSSDNHYYSGTPSPSPRPLSSLQHSSGHNTPNLTHPTVTSNQILNAPSYNNSARGWGCNSGTSTGYQHPQSHISANKPQIINTASMPYTDF
ncbi:nuclear polyadenylated RNA-binding protein 3 isoform X8 [Lucilia sericata]|uniref:nuclear polyadenylated RNA-binding protein 3 isoform X8 n=1 Tax=Lucilia sericata TaxID=13632 RepID=UPI0018A8289C|nr:nuclear polyadenylated RNA-binding protein 3 isoform X8 [Lucilia sericata]